MFSKLFKPKALDFCSPMSGNIVAIEDVKDPVFSSKSIGDGFAIDLNESNIYAPVDGEIVALFPSKHAIGIKGVDRNEYLVHIGLDTVNYKGKGFDLLVELGQKVKKGDLMLVVDLEYFRSEQVSIVSPVVVTNLNGRKIVMLKEGIVKAKEEAILAIKV